MHSCWWQFVWRFGASWEGADSRDRPGDTALDRAAILLDQPLPPNAGLFAEVEDALALDYLTRIWNLRPDLHVVSNKQAAKLLERDEEVLVTVEAAPVLLSELPEQLTPARRMAGADWLALTRRASLETDDMVVAVEQPVADGVILRGYRVSAAPTGSPVTTAMPAVDVTLYWQLDDEWPAEIGISLRPVAAGQFLPDPATSGDTIIQVDAAAPMQGLYQPQPSKSALISDSYRIPVPEGTDGAMLLVYRQVGETFENLVELPIAFD